MLYSYGDRAVPVWWQKHRSRLERLDNLEVLQVDDASSAALAGLAQPSMRLQCTLDGDEAWFSSEEGAAQVQLEYLKR